MTTSRSELNPSADRDDDGDVVRPNRTRDKEESAKEAAQRLDEIHQYLSDRYRRRDVIAQTRTAAGLQLDWVPLESLADGKPADPPDEDRPIEPPKGERAAEAVRFELEDERAERGPAGTVPLVRKPIERIRPYVGLNDWLAKGIRAKRVAPPDRPGGLELPGSGSLHKYASTSQSVTCYGTEGNINAWDPYVDRSDEFSLGQLALSRGSGNDQQTLEVGTQEYRDLYGDWVPHLFVFYTTNNYTSQGDNLGGYNQDVDGWVQYSSSIHPEAFITPLSVSGGQQYILQIKVQLWQGNWWVRVHGSWIGYYPASLYDTAGLESQASRVAWYGEVVDSDDDPATTRTDMGNGHWPYEGWQHCAYMNNLLYQSTTGGAMSPYNGASWASHPSCYNLETHFNNADSWGSYFWWGGSGRNAQCP
jgi:Neprosin